MFSFRAVIYCLVLVVPSFLTAADNPRGQPGRQTKGDYVGGEACLACHEALGAQFSRSVHARLSEHELGGRGGGCESCHGPGAKHAESGDPSLIFSFKRAEDTDINQSCLECHNENIGHEWAASEHGLGGLTCTDCHKIHQSRRVLATAEAAFAGMPARFANAPPPRYSLAKPEPQLCLECHKEKLGQMMLSSHHPVREGKMACSSCHEAHGSPVRQLKTEERVNDLCLKCHTSKQGPFIFEHAPVQENCLTCHDPHGTVANNLLRQNEPFLCLQCHEAHFHLGRSGQTAPLTLPTGSATNRYGERGWRAAFGTKCTQCHTMIHGTDLPGHSTPSRGKALTR
jgi:predicted CXXCH cytochrome family protein